MPIINTVSKWRADEGKYLDGTGFDNWSAASYNHTSPSSAASSFPTSPAPDLFFGFENAKRSLFDFFFIVHSDQSSAMCVNHTDSYD